MTVKTPAKEIIKPYVEQGLSIQEIADITGIKYTTVQAARRKMLGASAKSCNTKRKKGWNKDRHACRVCQYRMPRTWATRLTAKCNYLDCEGKMRPCKVEDCNVYQRGPILKGKDCETG